MKNPKPKKARKSILEQVFPLVVAYREVQKIDWQKNDRVLDALAHKTMKLLVTSSIK